MSVMTPLKHELETFEKLGQRLQNDEGRFALVSGEKLIGIFDGYQDALEAGYKECGLKPFLVKRISAIEVIANFTRDLGGCTAPIQ